MTTNCLVIFIKTPIPNLVKTRLQPQIIAKDACKLYSAFLKDINTNFAVNNDFDTWYAVAPENFEKEKLEKIVNLKNHFFQKGKSLGERMNSAYEICFNKGYKSVIIIGSDLPDLPVDFVKKSFSKLKKYDCVIGPSEDGGYYLIGLNKSTPSLFENIDWSTDKVLTQTAEIADRFNLSVFSLEQLYDLDTYQLLKKYYYELKKSDKSGVDFPQYSWKMMKQLFDDK